MKVMGFSDLVLVAPRFDDVLAQADAHAMASGATDVLERARIVPTLTDALDGITYACATAMTPRDFGPPTRAPRELFDELAPGTHRVAFVFGSERFGMSNDDVYRCHVCLSIPTLPEYGSLNLAQAVQLLAYDWRQALGGFPVQPRTVDAARRRRGRAGSARPLAPDAAASTSSFSTRGAAQADAAAAATAESRAADRRGSAHPARHRTRGRQGTALTTQPGAPWHAAAHARRPSG